MSDTNNPNPIQIIQIF